MDFNIVFSLPLNESLKPVLKKEWLAYVSEYLSPTGKEKQSRFFSQPKNDKLDRAPILCYGNIMRVFSDGSSHL